MTEKYVSLDNILNKQKSKLNRMVLTFGCLHEETIKQSELVDQLIVLKMREQLQKKVG